MGSGTVEHAPDAQKRLRNGRWVGKCRCGVPFKGKDLLAFLAAWAEHNREIRTANG